jgi:glycosyltransferase involved in cell wall biosynthesis
MTEGLRIAVYHNLLPGGAKRSLFEMVRRLARDHQIDLFTLSTADHDFCDVRPYVERVVEIPFTAWSTTAFKRPFGRLNKGLALGNLLRLRRLCREISCQIDAGGYDVVFVHHCRYTQSPSVLEFLETPSVYFCQESVRWVYEPPVPRAYWAPSRLGRSLDAVDVFNKSYVALLKRLDQINARRARRVLVNSYFSRESIYRIYGINGRVCYLGVDTGHFRPLEVAPEEIVLCVGSVTPAKGNELVVEGLGAIPEARRPPMVLASHAANPDERAFLAELAAARGVDLEFRDLGDNGYLVELYSAARVTAYTPYLEPLGLVPLESMACGTPVVGVREGGVRETVDHGETGLLVDRDPEAFAEAVETLFGDPAFAQRCGALGRERVAERWTWERNVAQVERHLLAVADGAKDFRSLER